MNGTVELEPFGGPPVALECAALSGGPSSDGGTDGGGTIARTGNVQGRSAGVNYGPPTCRDYAVIRHATLSNQLFMDRENAKIAFLRNGRLIG